jgi:hypothetical protein
VHLILSETERYQGRRIPAEVTWCPKLADATGRSKGGGNDRKLPCLLCALLKLQIVAKDHFEVDTTGDMMVKW